MYPHGNEGLQQTDRWLGIEDALFCGPATALRVHDLVLDRDAEVLVKADEPVDFGRLVEQGALHGHRCERQQCSDVAVSLKRRGELPETWHIEDITTSGHCTDDYVDGAGQLSAVRWRQNISDLSKAEFFEQSRAGEGDVCGRGRDGPHRSTARTGSYALSSVYAVKSIGGRSGAHPAGARASWG